MSNRSVELLAKEAKVLVVAVNVIVVATLVMLSLGFVLLLAGASPDASFVDWLYRNIERSMGPFRGMFPIEQFDGRSVFDPSLLFAAAVYGFAAIALQALVAYLTGLARSHHLPSRLERPVGDTPDDRGGLRCSNDVTDPLVTITERVSRDTTR